MEIDGVNDSVTTVQQQFPIQDRNPNSEAADTKIGSEPPSFKEERQRAERSNDNRDKLEEVSKELNKYAEMFNTKLSFCLDEETNRTVIKIINNDTGELIRQVPPEEMLRVLSKITEMLGLLIDEKV